jgi:hypothetical protein
LLKRWKIRKSVPFLSTGDLDYFFKFEPSELYEDESFRTFVSPYFAVQYDRALVQSFRAKQIDHLVCLVRTPLLLKAADRDKAYYSLNLHLDTLLEGIENVYSELKKEGEQYDLYQNNEIEAHIKSLIPAKLINILSEYYVVKITRMAFGISDIAAQMFNEWKETTMSAGLIQFALTLNIDQTAREELTNNYQIITRFQQNAEHNQRHFDEQLAKIKFIEALFQAEREGQEESTFSQKQVQQILGDLSFFVQNDYLKERLAAALYNLSLCLFQRQNYVSEVTWLLSMAKRLNPGSDITAHIQSLEIELNHYKEAVTEAVIKTLEAMKTTIEENIEKIKQQGVGHHKAYQMVVKYFKENDNAIPFKKGLQDAFNPQNINILAEQPLLIQEKIVSLLEIILGCMPSDYKNELMLQLLKMTEKYQNLSKRLKDLSTDWNTVRYATNPVVSSGSIYYTFEAPQLSPPPPSYHEDEEYNTFDWGEAIGLFFIIITLGLLIKQLIN